MALFPASCGKFVWEILDWTTHCVWQVGSEKSRWAEQQKWEYQSCGGGLEDDLFWEWEKPDSKYQDGEGITTILAEKQL